MGSGWLNIGIGQFDCVGWLQPDLQKQFVLQVRNVRALLARADVGRPLDGFRDDVEILLRLASVRPAARIAGNCCFQ